jgi:hypothetical protein
MGQCKNAPVFQFFTTILRLGRLHPFRVHVHVTYSNEIVCDRFAVMMVCRIQIRSNTHERT